MGALLQVTEERRVSYSIWKRQSEEKINDIKKVSLSFEQAN